MSAQLLASIRASDPSGSADRRVCERKLCRASGLFCATGYAPMRIRTVDLSTKGIALLLPQALPDGTIGEVSFHLHLNGMLRRFSAKVEISNSVFLYSDVRAGCRFVFLNEESKKTLGDFMR